VSPIYVHVALTAACAESFGLGLLLLRVKGLPGLRLLVAFLFGVGLWIVSCELPTWLGPAAIPIARVLVAFSALTSAVFVHFVLVLCGASRPRWLLRANYGAGAATSLLALLIPPGAYGPWHGIEYFFLPNAMGWIVGVVWSALAIAGHAVLFWFWLERRGPPRGQLVAMCLASGWGALCMLGYAFPALHIEAYPFPLLFLPLYPLILVYGILRYQLMVVNAWARRALAWTLLVGLGSAAVIGLAALPLPFNEPKSGWSLWLVAVVTLLAAGLLLDPFRRLATRLVYPGSQVSEESTARWRAALADADSFESLAALASRELSTQLRLQVDVAVSRSASAADNAGGSAKIGGASAEIVSPTLRCERRANGWITELSGWDAAPPGPRYVAQLFGALLTESAERLERAMALADRERERQKQERLAELGALAATVAHDIRNPLNIIAMAAAGAAPEVRQEIAAQTSRISQLAHDLLEYAKSWQIEKQPLRLADHVRALLSRYPQARVGEGLSDDLVIDADPRRLTQALLNLLENARHAIADRGADGRIQIDASRVDGAVHLAVRDNGPGVPEEIRGTLFQPFVSRRADGTGLGLAIVAKIMQAHGGAAQHESSTEWKTSFVLSFPRTTS